MCREPVRRGRGRPPKRKLGAPPAALTENTPEITGRGRGRPQKRKQGAPPATSLAEHTPHKDELVESCRANKERDNESGKSSLLRSTERASTTIRPDSNSRTSGGPYRLDDTSLSEASASFGDLRDSPSTATDSPGGENLPNQAGSSAVALATPGDSEGDIEPPTPLPRTLNTAEALSAADPEWDPEAVTLLDMIAAAQDAADKSILAEANDAYAWTSDYASFAGLRERFTAGAPGPTVQHVTQYGNFCEIWDRRVMTRIANATNAAAQKTDDSKGWKPTNADELYVYFAMLICMAICEPTPIKEYWRTATPPEIPNFTSLMTYDRFVALDSMLTFVDSSAPAKEDPRVAQIRPIIDHCNEKFQSLYVLHENIVIDESLTVWKGHHGWVQDLLTKSPRPGIKTYELCESSSGYMWRFAVYAEKDFNVDDVGVSGTTLVGETSAIVLFLLEGLHHKGYALTMDNFYCSPALARHLKSIGVDCYGTIRKVRKNVPAAIKLLDEKTMAPDSVVAQHCGDVSILAWNGPKLVTTISTFHDAEMYQDKKNPHPYVILDYNTAMEGLEIKNHKLAMYSMDRQRGLKWHVRMFRRLLNASILNSFIMHRRTLKKLGREAPPHDEYRYALARQLLERHAGPPAIQRPPAPGGSRYDGADHYAFPIKTVVCVRCALDEDSNCRVCKTAMRVCSWCYSSSKAATLTCYECKKCGKALCVGSCFVKYHTRRGN